MPTGQQPRRRSPKVAYLLIEALLFLALAATAVSERQQRLAALPLNPSPAQFATESNVRLGSKTGRLVRLIGRLIGFAMFVPLLWNAFGHNPIPLGVDGFNALGGAAIAFLAGVEISFDTKGRAWDDLKPHEVWVQILGVLGLISGVIGFASFWLPKVRT